MVMTGSDPGDDPRDAAAGKAGRPGGAGAHKHDWIARQLRRVYDEALEEEIPPEMLAILGKLDEPTPGREGGA